MSNYIILTDSTCDLPDDVAQRIGIKVIPLSFNIDCNEYRNYLDEREFSSKEFYRLLREGKMSTTSQINQSDFIEFCEEYLSSGIDILYIGFSSALSGTFNSGRLASIELLEKYPDRKFICVDSLSASVGEGMLVYNAAIKKDEGLTIDELADWLEENKLRFCHWFTVDDLHHLKRGGRVSSVAAVMGTALGIKPVLHVDNAGKLIPVSKVRGRKKSIESLYDKLNENIINPENQTIFIGHGDSLEDAELLAELIKKNYNVKDVVISYIGPVIGSHSGPGTIALFFIGEQR